MAQGDMNIANQGFPAFRADLNNQLEALVTNSSGSTAPATTFPHQWWLDTSTTPNTLRQRNAANDAWIVVGLFNQSNNTFNVPVAQGGTGAADAAGARTSLGLAIGTDVQAYSAILTSYADTGVGMRNKIINGSFQINQRGYVSGTNVGAAKTYTLDRWRVVTPGQNITFTASGNGNLVAAPAGGLEQVIEGVNIEGGTFVLNWTGTATATVNGTARAKGASFTLSANNNATVRFSGGTVGLVQLESGTVATPFEHRPYGTELALCQRYYATGRAYGRSHATAAFQVFNTPIYFPVTMRSTPTTTLTDGGSRANVSSVVLASLPFPDSSRLEIASAAAGDCRAIADIWTASAEL